MSPDEFLSDLAAIYARDPTGETFGSGRLIAPGLILTAGHVVDYPTRQAPLRTGWKVCLVRERSQRGVWTAPAHEAELVWRGADDLDLALLRLVGAATPTPTVQPVFASHDVIEAIEKVDAAGFPQAWRTETNAIRDYTLNGELRITSRHGPYGWAVQPADKPDDRDGWKGMSGGAVCKIGPDGKLYLFGALQSVPANFSGGLLDVARLSDAFPDERFCEELRVSLGYNPRTVLWTKPDPEGFEANLRRAEALLERLPLDYMPAPKGPQPGSWMPVRRNPLFVGRKKELMRLAEIINAGKAAAVSGIGGIGKTQLAVEFVYRYGQFFAGGVFWLNFARAEDVSGEVARCGGAGGLALDKDFDAMPQPQQVDLVRAAWRSELPRILVFDNCEDKKLLEEWRPPHGGSRVVLTSRRSKWPASLGVQGIPLDPLARAESLALLRKHRDDLPENDPDLNGISEALGDLPLALHLAGSYLENYGFDPEGTPSAYLAELRRPDLLAHTSLVGGDYSPTGHELHIANTFALSFGRLDLSNRIDVLARASLFRAACFAPGVTIPRNLLRSSLRQDQDASKALGRGVELGLIDERTEDGALMVHPLLTTFFRREAGPLLKEALDAVEMAVVNEACCLNDKGDLKPLAAWQPHLRFIAENADERCSQHAANLLNNLGCHLHNVGDPTGARVAYERALAIDERIYGRDHPNVANHLNGLGVTLLDLGDLEGARAAFERGIAIEPDTPTYLNNLAWALRDMGKLMHAERLFCEALDLSEKVLGRDHDLTAKCLSNLGLLRRDMGEYAEAERFYERALKIRKVTVGDEHPHTATILNNLAGLYRAQKRYREAESLYRKALNVRKKKLGPEHRVTVISSVNLALLYRDEGKDADAEQLFQDALPLISEIEPLYKRAYKIRKAVLGDESPDVLKAREDLTCLQRVIHEAN